MARNPARARVGTKSLLGCQGIALTAERSADLGMGPRPDTMRRGGLNR